MAANLKQRLEILSNGTTLTNRLTGDKSMSPNNARLIEMAKSFITDNITEGEPGIYFDVDISITKGRNKKPGA